MPAPSGESVDKHFLQTVAALAAPRGGGTRGSAAAQ
jgi:hypothetical protein